MRLTITLNGYHDDHNFDGPPAQPWWARTSIVVRMKDRPFYVATINISTSRCDTAWEAIDEATQLAVRIQHGLDAEACACGRLLDRMHCSYCGAMSHVGICCRCWGRENVPAHHCHFFPEVKS
jgi:hypothetical protein